MYLTTCDTCGHERIRENCTFSQSRCNECGSVAFGLIEYSWISEDEAHRLEKEKNLTIEQ